MNPSTLLIVVVLLALVLWVSIRSRAVLPALVAGVLITVLVCGAFSGLAPAISSGIQGGGDAGAHAVSAVSDATTK